MSEIIIDDVNVEECSYYNKDNAPYCCEVWDNECEAQNCYYKQLKRLQAENERLKNFCIQLEKAKKEQHLQWQQRCTENHNEDSKIINKYRKALEEIREMFDNCCFKANFLNNYDSDCKYINECNGELSVIQKIINEVLK